MSGDRYFITDQFATYFLTFTVIEWIDVFTRKEYKQTITDSLNYCVENKGLLIYAWCLMPSHLHLIGRTEEPFQISNVIRDFKSHTAKEILGKIQIIPESRKEWLLFKFGASGKKDKRITQYKFWKEDNHAICLGPHDHAMWEQRLDYIHMNPVKDETVELPEEYLYSSAKDFAGGKGLVKLAAFF